MQLTSSEKLKENIKNKNEELMVEVSDLEWFKAHEKEDENQKKQVV